MIVQESHKKVAGITVRAEYVMLHLLAKRICIRYFAGCELAFCHAREFVEKWEVESSIDAYNIACIQRIAANKARNCLLVVINFTEGKKVLFADTEGKFAHGVGKSPFEIGADVL